MIPVDTRLAIAVCRILSIPDNSGIHDSAAALQRISELSTLLATLTDSGHEKACAEARERSGVLHIMQEGTRHGVTILEWQARAMYLEEQAKADAPSTVAARQGQPG